MIFAGGFRLIKMPLRDWLPHCEKTTSREVGGPSSGRRRRRWSRKSSVLASGAEIVG
jgi:hypothetical protein